MSLTTEQREWWDKTVARWRDTWGEEFPPAAVANHFAACEALLREIGAYCEPIAPGLDPVGLSLYARIGPLLAVEE